jgi:hypothetical protein
VPLVSGRGPTKHGELQAMKKRQWLVSGWVLIALAALIAVQSAYGEEPQVIKTTGVIDDVFETEDGEEVLTLVLRDETILALQITPATEVWNGEVEASTDLLWEAMDEEVEVEYVVQEGRNVLRKVSFLSEFGSE